MPVPDPIPSPRHSMMQGFRKIVRLLVLLALIIAALAVILVSRGDPDPLAHVHMLVATALGTGLTVLVGTGLMTLVFMSNSTGHDDAAAKFQKESDAE